MSGQSPRVADAAPAFVGGHPPSDGEQVGREGSTAAPSRLHRGSAGQRPAAGPPHRLHELFSAALPLLPLQIMILFFFLSFFFSPERMGTAPWPAQSRGRGRGQ